MKGKLKLKEIKRTDCQNISESFQKQGWNKPISQYEKYVEYQEKGERDVIVAELNQEFAKSFRLCGNWIRCLQRLWCRTNSLYK